MSDHIQIGDITPRIGYTADGATANFTFPFPIFQDSDLEVYVDGLLKALTTDYSLTGAGQSSGGSITFTSAPLDQQAVTLVRRVTIVRTSDFQNSGEFRAKVINDELDFQTAALQQVQDDQKRSIHLKRFDPTVNLEIPAVTERANKLAGFDGDGNLQVSTLTIADIEAHATEAAAQAAADSATNAANSASAALVSETAAAQSKTDTETIADSVRQEATGGHLLLLKQGF